MSSERVPKSLACRWCGYPESTHASNTPPGGPHPYEVSDCTDPWHGEHHGLGSQCPDCMMMTALTPLAVRRITPRELWVPPAPKGRYVGNVWVPE